VKTPQEHAAALHDHLAHNSLVWGEVVLKVEQVIGEAMAESRAAAMEFAAGELDLYANALLRESGDEGVVSAHCVRVAAKGLRALAKGTP
jgi:hypothetical protein